MNPFSRSSSLQFPHSFSSLFSVGRSMCDVFLKMGSGGVSPQTVQGPSRSLFILLLTISPAHAILDTNQNGASDLWERHHNNGNLYSNFIPTADPDGDGWTNAQEAAAGTHPADANPPTGFLRPEITHYPAVYGTPEAVSIEWTPLAGKKYSLFASSDLSLGSWIPIGEPQIGNRYFTPSFYIQLTQPDGSTPEKLFFRLSAEDTDTDGDTLTDYEESQLGSSPYSADGDGDGLSDWDELFVHHTNPNSRDSDGDGVSDWDEIMVNFTNPLSGLDGDSDGIPDDLEKHLARQLLNFQPDAAYWSLLGASDPEALYEGLLQGDLNADFDYTGEGISAQGLAGELGRFPGAATPYSKYLVEPQSRRYSIPWAYHIPANNGQSSSNTGQYRHSRPYDYDAGGAITPWSDFTLASLSQYLVSRIDSVEWGKRVADDANTGLTDWDSSLAFYWSEAMSGIIQTPISDPTGTRFEGTIIQRKFRVIATRADHEGLSQHFLKVTSKHPFYEWGIRDEVSVEPFSIEIPKGKFFSGWFEFEVDMVDGQYTTVQLLPVEVAPEVLAVNSDFDEGRIDPATGYAIPDCDDTDIALEAVRNHLDGKFAINERITDDMHPGFFGVNPSNLGDDFWASANVTIRKIEKDDPATGHPESGHIRLYGKWGNGLSEYRAIAPYDFETLAATNLAIGGINGASSEIVYGAASPFPDGTSYFIEGVHPGKITLEWRYQKGSVDFKYEQKFEIYTKKSAPQWRFDLDYKIRLETSNDPSGEIRTIAYPLLSDGYEVNTERASEFYDFYRECFHEPLRSNPTGYPNAMSWPGLARLAGSQVIGGLSDSEWGRRALAGSILIPAVYPILNPLISGWSVNEIEQLQLALFQGGWQIFASAGWQHHAYRSSGYQAIEWVATETEDLDAPLMLPAWRDLHQGVLDHDKFLVDRASLKITDREQNHTIVPTWTVIAGLGLGLVDDMFSILGTNSCSPAGLDFSDLFMVIPPPPVIISPGHLPFGNLANTADRWVWIQPATSGGILDTWNTQPMARKLALSGDSLRNDAMRFSIFSKVSTLIPILCWDDADVR